MDIPAANNPKWAEILNGAKKYDFDYLAIKVFVGSALVQVKFHPERLGDFTVELRELLVKNQHIPSAQRDIKKIFG